MVLETDSLSSGQLGCEGIFSNNPLRRVFESTFVQAGMPIQTEQDLSHLFRISASSAGDIIYYYLSKPAPDFFLPGRSLCCFSFPRWAAPSPHYNIYGGALFFFSLEAPPIASHGGACSDVPSSFLNIHLNIFALYIKSSTSRNYYSKK